MPDRVVTPFASKERSDITRDDIDRIRRDVRATGLAEAKGTYIPGLFALAGPVLDMQGQAEAVVTLISTDPKLAAPSTPYRQYLRSFLGVGQRASTTA